MVVSKPAARRKPRTPVLIIPGFMSSGLAVRKSPHSSWKGKRLWLNIAAAGFHSLHIAGKLKKNEQQRSQRRLSGARAGDGDEKSSEEIVSAAF